MTAARLSQRKAGSAVQQSDLVGGTQVADLQESPEGTSVRWLWSQVLTLVQTLFARKPASAAIGNIATYANTSGDQLADSGVDIADVQVAVGGATANNFAGLDANGDLIDSGSAAADFDGAGSAAAVQSNLDAHTTTGTAHARNFGGSGAATTVARSDHDHSGVYVGQGGTFANGEMVRINGASIESVGFTDAHPVRTNAGKTMDATVGVAWTGNTVAATALTPQPTGGQAVKATATGTLTVNDMTGQGSMVYVFPDMSLVSAVNFNAAWGTPEGAAPTSGAGWLFLIKVDDQQLAVWMRETS